MMLFHGHRLQRYRSGQIRLTRPSTGQLDLNVLCIQHQTLYRSSSAIRGFYLEEMVYWGTTVDDCTD
jgi:hypothetical protein